MAVAGENYLPAHLPQCFQERRRRVGNGAIAPGDGAGVHLHGHAPGDGCVHGLQGGSAVAGIVLVKERPALVELGHQIQMPGNLRRALFVGGGTLGKVRLAIGIGVGEAGNVGNRLLPA